MKQQLTWVGPERVAKFLGPDRLHSLTRPAEGLWAEPRNLTTSPFIKLTFIKYYIGGKSWQRRIVLSALVTRDPDGVVKLKNRWWWKQVHSPTTVQPQPQPQPQPLPKLGGYPVAISGRMSSLTFEELYDFMEAIKLADEFLKEIRP